MHRILNLIHTYRGQAMKSWEMSWPMILIMLAQFAANITDVYIAGILGKEYQAATGFTTQIYFVFVILANAMTMGTVAITSRLYGSGNREKLASTISAALLFALLTGLILSLSGFFAAPYIMGFLEAPDLVKLHGLPLLRIYLAGLIFNYLFVTIQGVLRSTGLMRRGLIIMVLAVMLNIILTVTMVFFTPMGFTGIALSTVMSIAAGSFMGLIALKRRMAFTLATPLVTMKKVFSIGWPTGLMQVSWQGSSMVLFIILGMMGTEAVGIMAAFTNGLRVESVVFLPAMAFSMASAVITGNILGTGDKDGAFQAGIITAVIAVGFTLGLTLLIIVNAGNLAALLSRDSAVVDHTATYITISLLSEPFLAWAAVLGGALNGAGDTKGVLYSVIISIWLVRIPLAFGAILAAGMPILVLWWIMNFSMVIHAGIITRRYFGKKWMELTHE